MPHELSELAAPVHAPVSISHRSPGASVPALTASSQSGKLLSPPHSCGAATRKQTSEHTCVHASGDRGGCAGLGGGCGGADGAMGGTAGGDGGSAGEAGVSQKTPNAGWEAAQSQEYQRVFVENKAQRFVAGSAGWLDAKLS